MALPATGTATRDGSCCCGGGCGDCPCSIPEYLCVYLPAQTDPGGCPCGGEEYVEIRNAAAIAEGGDPCVWRRDACPPVLACPYPCSDDPGRVVLARMDCLADGTLTLFVNFQSAAPACDRAATGTAAGGAITCDPFTATFTHSFGDFTLTGAVVTAGPCGAPLMAAPRLMTATAPEPPCRWRGAELTGPERAALALDHRKAWYRCGKPDFPRLGLPVTSCKACKTADMKCSRAGCTGYEPADVDGRPDV